MKKLIATLLVAVMMCSLVACGNGGSSSEGSSSGDKVELTFWAHNDEQSWTNSYQAVADAFMAENPDIKISFETFPYDDYEEKVQTSLMSKKGSADIYEVWGGWGVDFCPSGALAEIPEEMAAAIKEEAYPCTYGALEYEDKLYGMPLEFNIECGGLLVNYNVMNEAGLSVPTTWDEVKAAGSAAAVEENGIMMTKGFDFVNWDSVPYLLTSMILSNGDNYLNEDGTFNFTSDAAKDAFAELTSMVMEDKVTDLTGLTDDSGMEGYQQLYAGQVAMVPRGPWTIAEGMSTFGLEYDKDFGYVAMPWYGAEPAFAAETGWGLAVSGTSEQQEAAFKFLEYFFQDDVLMQHIVNCGLIPAKVAVAQSEEYLAANQYVEPLLGILDKAQFIGYFNTDQFKETINNVFLDYCTGGIYDDIDAALADLETKCNEM